MTEHVFEVELLADHLLEGPETFVLRLSDGDPSDGLLLADASAAGTIVDDAPPVLFVDDFTGPEGTVQRFTVTLSGARAGETVTVVYEITGGGGVGEATAPGSSDPADFEPVPSSDPPRGVLTFGPGAPCQTSCTVEVSLLHDTVIEGPEELRLMLSSPSQAVLDEPYGVGTIVDVDPPVLSVSGFTGPEGGDEFFTVSLANPRLGETVTVDYVIAGDEIVGNGDTATAPGHPTKPADFEPVPASGFLTGTVTFGPGAPCQTSCPVEVSLLADYVPDEGDETLRLTLTNPSGAVLSGSDPANSIDEIHATGTIEDVDPPVLTVDDFTGPEGSDQSFTVSLANPRAGETVTVDYVIAGAGASPATDPAVGATVHDYTAASGSLSGTLTFRSGVPGGVYVLERSVAVSLRRDVINEGAETLRLTLRDPAGAVLWDRDLVAVGVQAYGEGTITNVDAPWLSVDNTSAREGEALAFTVTLCNPIPGEEVAVWFQTRAHSAAAGRDFDAAAGTVVFPDALAARQVSEGCGRGVTADAKSLTVPVTTLKDSVDESDEEVHLVLSAQTPASVGLGKKIGVGRIINVSAATVRVNDPTATEGSDLAFVISLVDNDGDPAVITEPVTVHYATADRTATAGADCADTDTDYLPLRSSVTFTPGGVTSVEVENVETCKDNTDEDDETVALVLRLAQGTDNAGLGDTEGTGTIEDADPPSLRIEDAAATQEGETMTFVVRLGRYDAQRRFTEFETSRAVTVFAATEDDTATAGDDYTATSRTLTIPAGETSTTFAVQTAQDDVNEPDEWLRAVLSNPSNALIDRADARGEIVASCVDEGDVFSDPPVITVLPRSYAEGERIFVNFELSRLVCGSFVVSYEFRNGTAECYLDFECHGTATQLRINPGLVGNAVDLLHGRVFTDGIDEPDETVTLAVAWAGNMPLRWRRLPAAVGELWFIDGDPAPSLSISDAAANEGEDLTFDVSLDTASGREVNVQYRTVQRSGTNAADPVDDYEPVTDWSPTIALAPGATSMPIMVRTLSDGDSEDDETFLVELREPPDPSTPLNAVMVDSVAVGTILSSGKPRMSIADAYADEGDRMRFVVTLSEPAPGPVTVSYATAELTGWRAAGEGADYEPVNDSLAFAAGDTEKFIDVEVNMDDEPEGDESFLVELSGPSPDVVLTDSSAVGTINGTSDCVGPGDTTPSRLTADSPRAREDEGTLVFELALDRPRCVPTDIYVAPSSEFPGFVDRPGIATPDADYVLRVTTPSIARLATELRVRVELTNDTISEQIETVELIAEGRCRNDPTCPPRIMMTGSIIDDDSQLRLPSSDALTEGGVFSFVVRLDRPSQHPVTFTYETVEGLTATPGTDFVPAQGTAEIPAGGLSVTVRVATRDDALDENDESLGVRVSDLVGALPDPGGDVMFGTIIDDDAPPSLRVSNASVDEGGDLEFTVWLDVPSGREVRVPVATRDGTARAAEGDYVALASGDVVFAPGVTRQTVRVRTLTDSVVESAESVFLDLGPMDNNTATIDKGIGRGEIRDVSDRRVSVSDAFVVEGGVLAFVVGFSEGPSSRDVVVRYRTRAGTAAAGGDYDDGYESVSQELRIVAGDTSAMVLVSTVDDSLDEDIESLELVLSDPQGAVIVAGVASGVIIDDDALPALRVSDTEASEGVGASAVFTLSLSEESGRDVTVTYSTADGAAAAGDDYAAVSGGEVVIGAGDRQVTVGVALVNDDEAEPVETFRLVVSGAVNASRDDSVGVATVTDDDGLVQVLVEDPAAVYEGVGVSAVFTVRLSRRAPVAGPVTVLYSTADGTAIAGSDYAAATSQTLTFAAGEIAKTVPVALVNDDVAEPVETFRLLLASPSSNAELGDDEASVLIRDDDGLPTVSVTDAAAATEGSTASFTVTLSGASTQEVTVDYAARADPLAAAETAAVPGQDYTAVSGTLSFAARVTEATVSVLLPDDSLDENTETFWLRLNSPVGATIVDGTATGTIVDDDPLPELSIGDSGATEGTPVRFTVSLDTVSGRTVTVPWASEALAPGVGAASPGADYTAAAGTLTLPPGATTVRFEVATLPDDVSEADEQFLVQLGTPTNAVLDDSTAIGAIRDDDSLPRIFIAPTTVTEDAGPAIFTVTLSHPSSQPVTVSYTTADGTATNPLDYAPDLVRTLTIPASFTVGEISVFIADDDLSEGTETFTITLTDAVNAVIAEGAGTATGTILDDDKTRIAIAAANAHEERQHHRVPRHAQPRQHRPRDSALHHLRRHRHPTPRLRTAATGTLTIPAGSTAATIAITLVDDPFEEEPESFLIRLSAPTGAEIATAEAVGAIIDDDNPPVLATSDNLTVREDVGSVDVVVTLDRPSDRVVRVNYETGRNSVTGPGCPGIVNQTGTLEFAPGDTARTVTIEIISDA